MIRVEYYTLHVLRLISAQFNSGYDEVLYALDSNSSGQIKSGELYISKILQPHPHEIEWWTHQRFNCYCLGQHWFNVRLAVTGIMSVNNRVNMLAG